MKPVYKEIETNLTPFEIFLRFRNEEGIIFLDSGMDEKKLGRYSIIVFNPFITFKGKDNEILIRRNGNTEKRSADYLETFRDLLKEYAYNNETNLPFLGGAAGYFAYNVGRAIENIPKTGMEDVSIPDIYFNFYEGSIIIDNVERKVYVTHLNINTYSHTYFSYVEKKLSDYQNTVVKEPSSKTSKTGKIVSNVTKEEYIAAINKVKKYILQGDTYEVNLSQRFEVPIHKSAFSIYSALREINRAPFAAFLTLDGFSVISSSPERFIKIKNRKIETRPIKGTIRRGKDRKEDELNRQILLQSEKDKAELLMIVDLERSDLSKICKKGTVKVDELFNLEKHPTVFHLVSNISGELKKKVDIVDCIKAMFPGGSITGAPKIRSMEIIDELEPHTRNIYTGSIGYIGYDGNADLNIVIRTILVKDNRAFFSVGGAITWDSIAEDEYTETLDKGRALMKVLS